MVKRGTNNTSNGKHGHPVFKRKLTSAQKLSDSIAKIGGSWGFIIGFFIFIAVWMAINALVLLKNWDPYPYILLNLVLSCLAAIQAPIILMSQNRQTERDRLQAKYDYQVNRRAEREIKNMQSDFEIVKDMIKELRDKKRKTKINKRKKKKKKK